MATAVTDQRDQAVGVRKENKKRAFCAGGDSNPRSLHNEGRSAANRLLQCW